jgi:hypothetical protein
VRPIISAGVAPADHDQLVRARPLLVRRELAAGGELDAERREVVGADDADERSAGPLALADADHRHRMRQHVVEQLPRPADGLVVGPRERAVLIRPRSILGEDAHHVGPVRRDRLEDQDVDDAEHGGVRADAQREHDHRDGGEAGVLREEPERVAEVLQKAVHQSCLSAFIGSTFVARKAGI